LITAKVDNPLYAYFPQEVSSTLSTECPECGFDLEPGKACRVCGFRPGAISSKGVISSPKARRRSSLGVLIASAGGLLAVLAVFIMVDVGGRTAETDQTTPLLTAAEPITAPEPLVAPPVEPIPVEEPTPPAMPAPTPVAVTPLPRKQPRISRPVQHQETGPIEPSPAKTVFDVAATGDNPPVTNLAAYVSWMLAHTDEKEGYLLKKWDRAQVLLRTGNITHERILQAFLRSPREFFARDARRAYENAVLPIGYGQTISGPHMVSRMTDYLDPQPEQVVLEIGTGSGYQSALLSELSNHVYTVEIVEALARETDAIYKRHQAMYPEYGNIQRKVDDGYNGWPEHAPFDRIIVTCGIDHVPPELLRELAPEGVMVIPVGPPSGQTILRITKHVSADGTVSLDREDIYQGKRKEIFVPFTSRGGGVHTAPDLKATE
jgi:protein-L-isoaspartate(D-aspartate) O-methyltransferase